MSDESKADWWGCPKCGEATEVNRESGPDEPDRYCTGCDWSVKIPRPEGSA